MKNKIILAVVVAGALMLAGYLFIRAGGLGRDAEYAVRGARDVAIAARNSPPTPKGSSLPLDMLNSVSDLTIARGDSGLLSEGQRVEYLRTAAAFCEGAMAPMGAKEVALSAKQLASSRFVREYADRFCDQPLALTEISSALDAVPADDDVIRAHALLVLEDSGDPGIAEQHAAEIVATSTSPSAIEIAARYLLYVRDRKLSVAGDVPVPASVVDVTGAQMLGVRMLICREFGGCGPTGLLTVLECSAAMNCVPGVTTSTVWRETKAPEFLAYADLISEKLRQERRR